MNKDWKVYAQYILDTIAKVERIQSRGSLLDDDILYDATIRNLQTLSEATQSIPDNLKAKCAEIPWKEISGFRNILVHNYLGDIDPVTIDNVIHEHLPLLKKCLETLLYEV